MSTWEKRGEQEVAVCLRALPCLPAKYCSNPPSWGKDFCFHHEIKGLENKRVSTHPNIWFTAFRQSQAPEYRFLLETSLPKLPREQRRIFRASCRSLPAAKLFLPYCPHGFCSPLLYLEMFLVLCACLLTGTCEKGLEDC